MFCFPPVVLFISITISKICNFAANKIWIAKLRPACQQIRQRDLRKHTRLTMWNECTFKLCNVTVIFGRAIFICLRLFMHAWCWIKEEEKQWYLRCQQMLFIYVIFSFIAMRWKKYFYYIFSEKNTCKFLRTVAVFGWICVWFCICDRHFRIPCALLPKAKKKTASLSLLLLLSSFKWITHILEHSLHIYTLTTSLTPFLSFCLTSLMHKLSHSLTRILSSKSDAKLLSTLHHCHITSLPYFLRSSYYMELKSFKVTVGICWYRLSMLF